MSAALSATPAVLTVELPQETIGSGQLPPEPLSRDAAEILGQTMAADLHRILGDEVRTAGLILTGALYDLTELLQPGLPMAEALLEVYRGSLRGGAFTPHRLTLGNAGGRFPLPELAPRRSAGAGPLLAVPFALVAPGPTLDDVRRLLEERLLERGAASLATDQAIRQQFGIAPVHLAYATFHDLSALLKVQLEHAGFHALWQVIEGALYRPDTPVAVTTDAGNRFVAVQGRAWTPYLTLDEWAERTGAEAPEGYAQWCRVQRQYMAGLGAHGIRVIPTAPDEGIYAGDAETAVETAAGASLADDACRRERVDGSPDFDSASAITLTEQILPAVGPIAYTVLAQNTDGEIVYLGHDYPLQPTAIQSIQQRWQAHAERIGASFQLERPGGLTCSEAPLRLMPWLDYGGRA